MRRIALIAYFLLTAGLPLIGITTPDTWHGSLIVLLLALLALAMGGAAATGRIPRYAPEVALLATIPFMMALLGEGAGWPLYLVPVHVLLGGQLSARGGLLGQESGQDPVGPGGPIAEQQ